LALLFLAAIAVVKANGVHGADEATTTSTCDQQVRTVSETGRIVGTGRPKIYRVSDTLFRF
jgi:hypothetical protein